MSIDYYGDNCQSYNCRSHSRMSGFNYPTPKQHDIPYRAPQQAKNPVVRGLALHYGASMYGSRSSHRAELTITEFPPLPPFRPTCGTTPASAISATSGSSTGSSVAIIPPSYHPLRILML